MTPRLPPSRLLLLATPSHDPLSRSPRHLPLLSLCLSLGVLLVVFPPLLTFPLRPRVPHSLLLLPYPLDRPFLFAYSLSLSRLLFLSRTAKENARDATRSFEIPDRGVPYVSASDRIAHLAAIFFRPLGRTFRYVLFLFFSLSLALSVCLPRRAPDSASFSSARRVRERTRRVCNSAEDVPLARSCNLLTRVSCFSRLSCPCFLATLAFVIFRYWVSRTVNCQLSATVVVPPVQNAQMRARACVHARLSLSLSFLSFPSLFSSFSISPSAFSLSVSLLRSFLYYPRLSGIKPRAFVELLAGD